MNGENALTAGVKLTQQCIGLVVVGAFAQTAWISVLGAILVSVCVGTVARGINQTVGKPHKGRKS
jgi:hypothetical protein